MISRRVGAEPTALESHWKTTSMTAPPDDPHPPLRSPRATKPILVGSSADRFEGLVEPRTRLDNLRMLHLDVGRKVVEVADGHVFMPDLIVMAMLQRSYGVVDALIDAVDSYNMHAAAPLLRLQLDTLFRASYLAACPDADDLARRLLAGEEFQGMTDSAGKKLTDARLQRLARANHEWAIAVYRQTSGWVHFSVSHMRATTQVGAENDFFMGIPLRPTVLPESLWLEVYGAASQATEEIVDYALEWASRKGLPPGETREINW